MKQRSEWRRALAGAAMAVLLALGACGGGGGGGAAPTVLQPPATAATLAASSGEAAAAAQGVVDGAARVVELSASLGQGIVPIGGSGSASPFAARPATREQAMLRETVGCAQFIDIPGCTGSVTIDTNLSQDATSAGPGTYIALTFGNVSASSGGQSLSINGTLRVDFLTPFDFNSLSAANQRFQFGFDGFSGSSNGVAFGPFSLLALVEFDAQEVSTITIDGARLSRLENAQVSDAANYALNNVALRRAAWSSATAYVDYGFANWSVVGARPTAGSSASASAGGNSIGVTVASSSSTTVVYAVVITVDGVASGYTVTASYPAGGGAPTYVAVPAGS
jgi:hypothetical protein